MRETEILEGSFDVSSVLEEEFECLHGALGGEYPRDEGPNQREQALRARIHALGNNEKRAALCLSGGGIRSATFSLGVLQALAARNEIDRFHYLSTVSGGGYIGSWLSSWILRGGSLATVKQQLAAPAAQGAPDPEPIRRLRAYSNYLSPVWGMSTDFFTLIATFLRNLTLHWIVLVPLIAAVLILPRIQLAVLGARPDFSVAIACLGVAVVLLAFGIAYVVADLPGEVPPEPPPNRFALCCFAPILLAALLLSWVGGWWQNEEWDIPEWYWFCGVGGLVHLVGVGFGLPWRKWRGVPLQAGEGDLSNLAFVLASGAAGGGILYLVATSFSPDAENPFAFRELYATVAIPGLLGCLWLGTTVYAGLARRVTSEDDREWWARSSAWWLGASVIWILGSVLVIYAPQWILGFAWFSMPSGPQALGVGGGLLGVLTGLIGYWSKNGARIKEKAKGVVAKTGLRLLDLASLAFVISLALTLSYGLSWAITAFDGQMRADADNEIATASADFKAFEKRKEEALQSERKFTEKPPESGHREAYRLVLEDSNVAIPALLALALIVIGVGASFFFGVNTFSLHSMYGNRLVRAYLGATRLDQRHPHWFTGFDPDDNVWMKDLQRKRLLHVVNIALNLVRPSGGRLEWQQRKAASFTVSPFHTGSASVRYVRTATYSGESGLSLGRALAISGAAASPNMGYHTSPIVAFVMAFFNIRLGWWLPNPDTEWFDRWSRTEPGFGIRPLLDEALARTTGSTPFVYLSDGGHFENLGLYEMVRRRCHRILVIDASCDPTYKCEDLENAIRKIRVDFGISIDFPHGPPASPADRAGGRRVTLGTIRYSDVDGPDTDGQIIYVKPMLIGDEPVDVLRYAASNSRPDSPFPHQTTADQFFDEAQFESYRMLGYHTINTGLPGIGQWLEGISAGQPAPPILSAPVPAPASAPSPGGSSSPGGEDEVSKLGDMMQSMGRGALLASALTVGGIVGVSGTVALKDSTVRLQADSELRINKEDLEKLRVSLQKPPGESSGASVIALVYPELAKTIGDLVLEISKLTKTLPPQPNVTNIEEHLTKIELLIRSQPGTLPDTRGILKELAEINVALAGVNKALMNKDSNSLLVAVSGDLKDVIKKLEQVDKTLGGINTSVEEIGLRQNTRRPSEGGGR